MQRNDVMMRGVKNKLTVGKRRGCEYEKSVGSHSHSFLIPYG